MALVLCLRNFRQTSAVRPRNLVESMHDAPLHACSLFAEDRRGFRRPTKLVLIRSAGIARTPGGKIPCWELGKNVVLCFCMHFITTWLLKGRAPATVPLSPLKIKFWVEIIYQPSPTALLILFRPSLVSLSSIQGRAVALAPPYPLYNALPIMRWFCPALKRCTASFAC